MAPHRSPHRHTSWGGVASVALFALASTLPAQDTTKTQEAPDTATNPHAVQPERPTVATHAGTVARGWFEIESGVERDQVATSVVNFSTPTTLKFGLPRNAQLSVFGSLAQPAGSNIGVGDMGAGVKWRIVDDAPVVGDFAILPSLKLPTGSVATGAGTGTTDVSLLLISSHKFGDVSMDLNVGYTRRSGNGSNAPQNASLWTASFGLPVIGALGWALECYGFPATAGPAGQPSIVALLGGPTWLAAEWLEVDAGVIVPVSGPQPHAVYAGMVYNVGQLWGKRSHRP